MAEIYELIDSGASVAEITHYANLAVEKNEPQGERALVRSHVACIDDDISSLTRDVREIFALPGSWIDRGHLTVLTEEQFIAQEEADLKER